MAVKQMTKLQREACMAAGIPSECVFAAAEAEGLATIVTNGGTKVRYRSGDTPKRLTRAQLGIRALIPRVDKPEPDPKAEGGAPDAA